MMRTTVLFFLLATSAIIQAQTINFQDISGVPGCSILRDDGAGTVYGVNTGSFGGDGRIYVSRDHGVSWKPGTIRTGTILDFAVRGQTLLVSRFFNGTRFSFQVHASTDGGAAWYAILSAEDFVFSGFVVSPSGDIFAFSSSGLVKCSGPFSWSSLGSAFVPANDAVTTSAMTSANVLFAGTTANGIFRSPDYGATWANTLPARSVTSINVVNDSTILVAAREGVLLSHDAGNTWSYLGLFQPPPTGVALEPSGTILATTSQGVYRTTDNGVTWTAMGPGNTPLDAILSTSDTIVTSSAAAGVFVSVDHGGHWSQTTLRGRDVFTLFSSESGRLFVGTLGDRIFSTGNGGGSWTQLSPGGICDYVFGFSGGNGFLYAGTDCGAFRSSDEGMTWQNLTTGSVAGAVYAIQELDDGTLVAGTNFGVYRSTDGGALWQPSGLSSSKVYFITGSGDATLYAATATDGIHASSDGGVHWQAKGQRRDDIQTLFRRLNGQLMAGVYGGVVRTSDGGAAWDSVRFGNGYVYAIDAWGPSTLLAATSNGLYQSGNGGGSWARTQTTGLPEPQLLAVRVLSDGSILTGAYRGGIYRSSEPLTGIAELPRLPDQFSLLQNYPNPFNPVTTIGYRLDVPSRVSLIVYDLLGREMRTLVQEAQEPGAYNVRFDGSNLSSGVYFYRVLALPLSSGANPPSSQMRKMVLLR